MDSITSFTGIRLTAILAALCMTLPVFAADNPAEDRIGIEVVDNVRNRIEAQDCSAAVHYLKAGLKKNIPLVSLLAGTMYEHGLCVKRDWSTAAGFYTVAFEGGLREGAERLGAGYADPVNGPDFAAALWWWQRTRSAKLPGCTVSKDAADDPDRFVAELGSWPASRLEGCNYMVGVVSMIGAELNYPALGQMYSLGGDIELRFFPGQGRIEVEQTAARDYTVLGAVDGGKMHFRHTKKTARSFETEANEVAKRALARYPQPRGISPDMKVEMGVSFTVEFR